MYPQQNPYGAYAQPRTLAGTAKVAFLRKVYGLFTTSILAAACSANTW